MRKKGNRNLSIGAIYQAVGGQKARSWLQRRGRGDEASGWVGGEGISNGNTKNWEKNHLQPCSKTHPKSPNFYVFEQWYHIFRSVLFTYYIQGQFFLDIENGSLILFIHHPGSGKKKKRWSAAHCAHFIFNLKVGLKYNGDGPNKLGFKIKLHVISY